MVRGRVVYSWGAWEAVEEDDVWDALFVEVDLDANGEGEGRGNLDGGVNGVSGGEGCSERFVVELLKGMVKKGM